MARVSDRELVAQWRRHFKNQPPSGLSIDKYCQREGIKAGTFYAWKRRLKVSKATATSRRGTTSKSELSRRKANGSTRAGGFVQVPLPVNSRFEVRFVDGTLLSLPAGNLEALTTTLGVLQAAQPEGGSHA